MLPGNSRVITWCDYGESLATTRSLGDRHRGPLGLGAVTGKGAAGASCAAPRGRPALVGRCLGVRPRVRLAQCHGRARPHLGRGFFRFARPPRLDRVMAAGAKGARTGPDGTRAAGRAGERVTATSAAYVD